MIATPLYLELPFAARTTDREPYSGRTRSGYGGRLPTPYLLKLPGDHRERRVRAMCWSNSATLYIRVKGKMLILRGYEFQAALGR